MRNWQKDWELCERATPGPWEIGVWYTNGRVNDGSDATWKPKNIPHGKCYVCHCEESILVKEYKNCVGHTMHLHKLPDLSEWREIYSTTGKRIIGNYNDEEGGVCTKKEDAEFIAEAREALPYWLKRVKELEKKNKKLQDDIAKLRKAVEIGQKWIGKVIRYLGYEQAEIDYLDVHEILRSIPLPDYGSGSITLED